MARRQTIPNIRLALVLGGIIWACVGAHDARAMGCHAPDRPSLGLTLTWDASAPLDLSLSPAEHPAPLWSRRPCPGDLPGSSSREAPPSSPALVSDTAIGAASVAQRVLPDVLTPTPLRPTSRLDRPPRLAALWRG